MAVRVTMEELQEVITLSSGKAAIRHSFIKTANTIVNTHLASSGHTEEVLKLIELYLAAHFAALTEEGGGLVGDDFGDSSIRLANVYEKGFGSTRFGQTALAIDSSGALANLGTGSRKAEFRIVGRNPKDETWEE